MLQGHLPSTWAIRFIAFPLMFNNFSQCAAAGLLLGWSSGSSSPRAPQTEPTVHLSRRRATEGEMDWTEVFHHRLCWLPSCTCRGNRGGIQKSGKSGKSGKVAVATGANTGWCHSSSIICSFFPMMI